MKLNNIPGPSSRHTTGNVEILYRKSTDGGSTFGSAENLTSIAPNSQFASVAASEKNVYLVWKETTPGDIECFYRKSIDNGATFGPVENLSNNGGASIFPKVAASSIP